MTSRLHAVFRHMTPGLLYASMLLGTLAIIQSFHLATSGPHTPMFVWFWGGIFAACLPLLATAIHPRTIVPHRILAILAIAAMGSLPKLLRTWDGPLFHDEYAHLRATTDLLTSGHVGSFNSIVTPLPLFPGLHYLTAAVTKLTAAPTWTVAVTIITSAHILGILGVLLLMRQANLSWPAASLAAATYVTNANWMYFHMQFSYESLGFPLVVWTLYCVAVGMRRPGVLRWFLALLAVALSYAIAAVHHLSALGLLALLGSFAVTSFMVRNDTTGTRPVIYAWLVFFACTAAILYRLQPAWQLIRDYLGSPLLAGSQQLEVLITTLLGRRDPTSSEATRSLFNNSMLPLFERIAAYAMPTLLALLVFMLLVSTWLRWRGREIPYAKPSNPVRGGLLLFVIPFFASLPLILTAGGAEGARRSWSYSMLGVALAAGLLFEMVLPTLTNASRTRRVVSTIIALWGCILLVGGVAAGVNEAYRFPIPARGVSDLTAASAETQLLGTWFADHVPANTWVLADRYSGMRLASSGGVQIAPASPSFPYWNLYWDAADPDPRLMAELHLLDVRYAVVDNRIATLMPENGFWFATYEPHPNGRDNLDATPELVARWDTFTWATKVYASPHYAVYALDLSRYNPFRGAVTNGGTHA